MNTTYNQENKKRITDLSDAAQKAISLFCKVDDIMKSIVFPRKGSEYELTQQGVIDYFDELDQQGMLEAVIDDLEFELTDERYQKGNEVNKMTFKIGKFYRHTSGRCLHILCRQDTTMWGSTLIAEGSHSSNLQPVGGDEDASANWSEITQQEWLVNFS